MVLKMNGKNDMVSFNLYCRDRLKKSLTYSICNGNFKNVRTLLENVTDPNKADVNETDEWWNPDPLNRNTRGKSAASRPISIYNNLPEIDDLKIILPLVRHKTTLTNQPKKTTGRTALMLCSMIEDQEWGFTIMQNLLEKGALTQLVDSNGHNALMYACMYQRSNLLELLLIASGDCNIYDKDIFGNTVFHLASLNTTDQDCLILHETFIKYQKDVNTKMIRNQLGHTPLDLCQINGHESCVKHLYSGLNDRHMSMVGTGTLSGAYFRKDSYSEDIQSEPADLPKYKQSNASLFATLLSIDESNTFNITNVIKKNQLVSKSNLQEYYKPLLLLKDKLIKKNTLYFNNILEPQKSSINFTKSERSERQKSEREIQLVTYRLIESNSLTKLNQQSLTSFNDETRKSNRQKASIERNWKSNMKKILDVLESSKSKSFRATNKNLSTNLFDQIANGILLKVANNPTSDSPSRRNSLFRSKQNSSLSIHANNNDPRRPSIASSVGKGKGSSQSRRPSITV